MGSDAVSKSAFKSAVLALGLLLAGVFCATGAQAAGRGLVWTGAWTSAQLAPDAQSDLNPADLKDATVREIVHLSLGGPRLRIRLSNVFGSTPLHVAAAHVARALAPAGGAIAPGTDRVLTFAGAAEATIPPGAEYWSDPVDLAAPALSDLAVSLYFDAPPDRLTWHQGSHATSYLLAGDKTAAPDAQGARRLEHWVQLSGVDVAARPGAFAIVAFGDSITDGHGSTTDGNNRWPDVLAARLQAAGPTRKIGVLNEGIGGNRVLLDSFGPNAMARLDRDVLAQSGVRDVIVMEGINDIGVLTRAAPASAEAHAQLVRRLEEGYEQIILKAHAHGLRVIGGAMTPFMGSDYYHPDAANEADRQEVNAWIRTSGRFDAVVDFDHAVRDPAHPERLRADYDSGDHLHPSPAGYRAMARAVSTAVIAP